jgi:transketolase
LPTASSAILDRGRPLTGREVRQRGDWIRMETIRLIAGAGLGHYSSTFSVAEVFAALYSGANLVVDGGYTCW